MAPAEIDFPVFHDSLDEIAPPCGSLNLVGHREPLEAMVKAVNGGHHALILAGQSGIGKATGAFHLANALLSGSLSNLDGTLPSPDISSADFRQIAQNAHPNLLYLTRPRTDDGKGFKTVITVYEVRRIQRFLGMTASAGKPRIVIIDRLEDMNTNAANAVLKLLEEPPSNTLFLLVSDGVDGMLPTIRSRCQIVRFSPLSDQDVATVLQLVAGSVIDEAETDLLAAISAGSVRQALLMALHGGLELREKLHVFLSTPNFDTSAAHKLAEVAGARGNDTHNRLLRQMLHDLLQERALNLAQNGNLRSADRLAAYNQSLGERNRIADGFNMDRKQEFLVVANEVHTLLNTA